MKKNIVITGGNSGIGLETARGLYKDGHNVIIGSRN
jgi:NAD(P)-dependent dehydrogenase (short-subunit alcohol dehydrogenase family)